jgi:hypothetical protein
MAQLRRPRTAVDPVALAWLNGPAAAALGLSPRGSLLAVVEGWEATVRCWVGLATAQGGRRDDALESRARDLEWADEPGCGRWSWLAAPSCALRVWPAAEAALVQAGARPRLLLDLLNGHATLALADAGALGATRTALLELVGAQALHGGGGLFVESQAVGLARRVDLPVRAPSPVEARSKAKFDPHGLLPPIPRPLEALR